MKKNKCRRHFCTVLVMLILTVGMCRDLTQADSVLAYAQDAEDTSMIRAGRGVPAKPDAYVEPETGNEGFSCFMLRSRRGREGKILFGGTEIITKPGALPGRFLFYTRKSEEDGKAENRSAAVIVSYVHRQDGAKG